MARRITESPGNLRLDIFGEGARASASSKNSLDSLAFEGGKAARVRKCVEEIIGTEALAQQQDLAAVIAGEPGHRLRELRKEGGPFVAE